MPYEKITEVYRAGIDDYVSLLRSLRNRDNANRRLRWLLFMHWLRSHTASQAWGLLRVLHLQDRTVPAGSDGRGMLRRLVGM
jgi:hypothetical protein